MAREKQICFKKKYCYAIKKIIWQSEDLVKQSFLHKSSGFQTCLEKKEGKVHQTIPYPVEKILLKLQKHSVASVISASFVP